MKKELKNSGAGDFWHGSPPKMSVAANDGMGVFMVLSSFVAFSGEGKGYK